LESLKIDLEWTRNGPGLDLALSLTKYDFGDETAILSCTVVSESLYFATKLVLDRA